MEHTVSITITFATVMDTVKSWLSVVGKRTDGTGNPPYSKVTLSSAELSVLKEYVSSAARTVATAISRFVRSFSITDTSATFSVVNTRWAYPEGDSFDSILQGDIAEYCAASAAAEYLAMYYAELAQKHAGLAQAKMGAIMRLVYFKIPPVESAKDMGDVIGTAD